MSLQSPFVQQWTEFIADTWRESPYHLVIEAGLFMFIIYLLTRRSYDPRREQKRTKKEEDELIAEWEPEPLAPPGQALRQPLVVESATDAHITCNGKEFLNFASTNFLGLANHDDVKAICKATITKYGVGSCGPRGFYGTIDVHLHLEEQLAQFFDVEEAIIYSDAIACISSVIPCFAKRGDLIICDEGVHFGIQQGINLSRSNVLYYKHNDMVDLKRTLDYVREKDRKNPSRKLNRRFIVTEGIFQYHGDLTPIDLIVQYKNEYKYRLILDDSMAFGVLGATGRGTPEHFKVPIKEVEMYCVGMDNSLATSGGFCVGTREVTESQRLSGAGYCFSASAPPFASATGQTTLKLIETESKRLTTVRNNALLARKQLSTIPEVVVVGGHVPSPIIHLRLQSTALSSQQQENIIDAVVKKLEQNQIAAYRQDFIPGERNPPRPSLRVCISANHTEDDLQKLLSNLKSAFASALGDRSEEKNTPAHSTGREKSSRRKE